MMSYWKLSVGFVEISIYPMFLFGTDKTIMVNEIYNIQSVHWK